MSRARRLAVGLLVASLLALPGRARAETWRVDWQRGLLIASGSAVGDLRAPSRQLARVKAERVARKRCRAKLLERAASLPVAGPAKLGKDEVKSVAEGLLTLHTDFGSDGSVVVDMALPLDALRSVTYGADAPIVAATEGPRTVIVDASELKLRPALGYALADGENEYRGPVLFFTDPAEAREALGMGEEHKIIRASSSRKGVLAVDSLEGLIDARPLVAIVWKDRK